MSTTIANGLVTASASAAMAMVGFMTGVGGVSTFESVTSLPGPRSLTLVELDINPNNGIATQRLEVQGGPITGKWSAEIVRDGFQLCSGGGVAPYKGERVSMTIDKWVGEPCPPLYEGDIARASWEYENQEGHIISLSGQIVIGEDDGNTLPNK